MLPLISGAILSGLLLLGSISAKLTLESVNRKSLVQFSLK